MIFLLNHQKAKKNRMYTVRKGQFLLDGKFKFKSAGDRSIVVCQFCSKEFRYHRSTSSLSYHLAKAHPYAAHASRVTEVDMHVATAEGQPSPPKECKQSNLSYFPGVGPNTPVNKIKSSHLTARSVSKMKSSRLTSTIAMWIAKNARPLNIVEDDGLRDVLRVALSNDNYTPPSCHTIQVHIDDLYNERKTLVREILSTVNNVALTTDYWASLGSDSYLGVTCHFINPNSWKLHSFAIAVENSTEWHYAVDCANSLEKIAEDWNVSRKITTLHTDNAQYLTNVTKILTRWEHLPCAAHCLHLSVTKGLSLCGIDNILAKVRKIVGHFKHSPANCTELNEMQKHHSKDQEPLIQDVPTRWISTLLLITRFLKHSESVEAVLSVPHHKHNLILPNEAEIDKLKYMEKLLMPCKEATDTLGGEKFVSCSIVLPLFAHLEYKLQLDDNEPGYVSRFKQAFLDDLKNQKVNMLQNCWLEIATALDPRFKNLKCLPKERRSAVWIKIMAFTSDLVSISKEHVKLESSSEDEPVPCKHSKFQFLESNSDSEAEGKTSVEVSALNIAKQEVEHYKALTTIPDEHNPLDWWQKNQKIFPRLSMLALRYLGSPATTVPCERLFSLAGDVISQKSGSLKPDHAQKLICLSNWLQSQI